MPDASPFAMAGLYDRWLSPDGDIVDSCTIVTTSACESLRGVHDRMPVILPRTAYARWLARGGFDVADLLVPWSGAPLCISPVSSRVNAAANDDARLLDVAESEQNSGHDDPVQQALFSS